jgi:hypothetical protein
LKNPNKRWAFLASSSIPFLSNKFIFWTSYTPALASKSLSAARSFGSDGVSWVI